MAYMRTATLATVALGLVAGFGSPVTRAHAAVKCAMTVITGAPDLQCSTGDGDEEKFFAIKGGPTQNLFGSLGKNNGSQDVELSTDVPVQPPTNGFGEIKPTTDPNWRVSDFTQGKTGVTFDGVFLDGQIIDAAGSTFDGTLTASVEDVSGNVAQFTWTGLKTNADLHGLGFDEVGSGIAIFDAAYTLDSTGIFKSNKQIEVSLCLESTGCVGGGGEPPGIPEPSTWAMLMLGFVGLGFAAFRRAKAHPILMA